MREDINLISLHDHKTKNSELQIAMTKSFPPNTVLDWIRPEDFYQIINDEQDQKKTVNSATVQRNNLFLWKICFSGHTWKQFIP